MSPKPDKLIPALYGGVIMALLSTVPFLSFINCLCCAGILLGGFFAVFFYKNNFTPDTPPYTSGDCVALGALAGVFGAIIGTILSTIFMILFGNIMGEMAIQWLQNMNINIPSEALDAIEESLNIALSPISIMISLFTNLVIDVIFGLLGGLIGYSVYKPKPQAIPPSPPVQPI
jgi:hypothetical protein